MNWHAQSANGVVKNLGSSHNGLSEKESHKRLGKFGKNILEKHSKKGRISVLIKQFNSLLIYVLIIAVVISALIGHIIDAVVIGVIIFLNAGIGFVQEYKAEEIIEKLKKSLRYDILVLREGKQIRVDSKFLVPGDVVVLNTGDRVLADCRILENEGLYVNEAVLSGESFPVEKNIGKLDLAVVLAERKWIADLVSPVRSSAMDNIGRINTQDNPFVVIHEFGHIFGLNDIKKKDCKIVRSFYNTLCYDK